MMNKLARVYFGFFFLGASVIPLLFIDDGTRSVSVSVLFKYIMGGCFLVVLSFFVLSGRGRVNIASASWLCLGVFLYLPAFHYISFESVTLAGYAASVCLILQLPAYWLLLPQGSSERIIFTNCYYLSFKGAAVYCLIPYMFFLFLYLSFSELSSVSRFAMLAPVFLLFASACKMRFDGNSWWLLYWLSSLVLFFVWYQATFHGFGRINVVSPLFAMLAIWLYFFPSKLLKLGVVVFIPIGLIWGGMIRLLTLGKEVTSLASILWEGEGLGSVYAPFYTWVELISKSNLVYIKISDFLGQLIFAFFFWIPRSIWNSKPDGFGRMLTYELRPELLGSHHSMAAGHVGEGYAYFGAIGPAIAVLVWLGLIALVNWLVKKLSMKFNHLYGLIGLIILFSFMSQLLTFVWGGIGTYGFRSFSVLFGILFIYTMMRAFGRHRVSQ